MPGSDRKFQTGAATTCAHQLVPVAKNPEGVSKPYRRTAAVSRRPAAAGERKRGVRLETAVVRDTLRLVAATQPLSGVVRLPHAMSLR